MHHSGRTVTIGQLDRLEEQLREDRDGQKQIKIARVILGQSLPNANKETINLSWRTQVAAKLASTLAAGKLGHKLSTANSPYLGEACLDPQETVL